METLEGIMNTLWAFIKVLEVTKMTRYTSYATICVYMNVPRALSESVTNSYQDSEWSQTLDYKHIPFRCRKFHIHVHLFRYFPLKTKYEVRKNQEGMDVEGFTNIQGKHKAKTQPIKPTTNEGDNKKNWFKSLDEGTN
jgi:hypothetical protein